MFLRSKHESNRTVVNSKFISVVIKADHKEPGGYLYSIDFKGANGGSAKWVYAIEKQRDDEYSWILSQLDCRVNEENEPFITKKTEDGVLYCHCGSRPLISTLNLGEDEMWTNIECLPCKKSSSEKTREDAIISWNGWQRSYLKP